MKRLSLLILTAVVWFIPTTALAEQAKEPKITISPAFKEITLEQGQLTATYEIEIINNADTEIGFGLIAVDFKSLDETGGIAFIGPTGGDLVQKYGIAKWVKVHTPTVELPPKGRQKVTVEVQNLPDLSPGGHYGALLIEALSAETGDEIRARVSLRQTLTSLLFVKKVGGERYDISLNETVFAKNWWKLPKKINLRFYNAGNVYVVPRGRVELYDPAKRLVADASINTDSLKVLPETYRQIPVNMSGLARAWLPGTYTLKVMYRYDGHDGFATKQYRFLYIPPYVLVTAVLLSGGGAWGAKKLFKRHRRKAGKAL